MAVQTPTLGLISDPSRPSAYSADSTPCHLLLSHPVTLLSLLCFLGISWSTCFQNALLCLQPPPPSPIPQSRLAFPDASYAQCSSLHRDSGAPHSLQHQAPSPQHAQAKPLCGLLLACSNPSSLISLLQPRAYPQLCRPLTCPRMSHLLPGHSFAMASSLSFLPALPLPPLSPSPSPLPRFSSPSLSSALSVSAAATSKKPFPASGLRWMLQLCASRICKWPCSPRLHFVPTPLTPKAASCRWMFLVLTAV